jgi:hypothetical protein
MDARLSRRQLLQVGGIGALGLGLPQLLRGSPGAALGRGPARSCIFIVQYGGASHIDSLDPKPNAPDEIRGPYRPIATNVPGVRISDMLPRMATMADRYCLVRSMTHDSPGHDMGMHVAMTGHLRPKETTPYYGSIAAKLRPSERNVPSYVWIQNLAGDVRPWYLTGGFLGPAYSPLRVGTDQDNPSAPNFRMTAFDPAVGMTPDRLNDRRRLLEQVQTAEPLAQAERPEAMRRYQERATELVSGPDARQAFDLAREPAGVRDRYGRHALGQNLLMARRLIEAGVRLVSVTAWTGLPPGERFRNVQTWDMHGEGAGLGGIFNVGAFGLGWALPRVDEAVSALLDDLHVRGLLESTLVVMVGEFGRTPNIVRNGRDHWSAAYSAFLAGGGIRGGRTYGASDRIGAYVKDDPVTPENFGATLFHALGIAPETRLGADGFTHPVSTGRPILDLFA